MSADIVLTKEQEERCRELLVWAGWPSWAELKSAQAGMRGGLAIGRAESASRIAELEERVRRMEGDAKDAERYRHLRANSLIYSSGIGRVKMIWPGSYLFPIREDDPAILDAAIDAKLTEAKQAEAGNG